jgi:hypothetical protein
MSNKSPERIKAEERFLIYRIKNLPEQLDRAYRRVDQLEREAIRLNMEYLLRRSENASDR